MKDTKNLRYMVEMDLLNLFLSFLKIRFLKKFYAHVAISRNYAYKLVETT